MGFQITALSVEQFSHLFGKDSQYLEEAGVERVVVDANPGYPCRVSLQDAEPGETVLLLNYEHQPARSPYRSTHAIFVREWAEEAKPDRHTVPEFLKHRLLSVRAFDNSDRMVDADVVDGRNLGPLIERLFENDSVGYLHIHNAKLGCYAALAERDSTR